MKLALPTNKIYDKLIEKLDNFKDIEPINIYRVSEEQCLKLLMNNRVDAAFLNPVTYGLDLVKNNFRVIKGPIIALKSFTKTVSILFKENLIKINNCAAEEPNDYLMKIGKILLAERYNIYVEVEKAKIANNIIPDNIDCVITYSEFDEQSPTLDISEDWYDTFDQSLLLGFWATKASDFHPLIEEAVNNIFDNTIIEDEIIENIVNNEYRFGKIIYKWNKELEDSLKQNFEMLFYHKFLEDIPDLKYFDKDEEL